ncbi:RsmB/NOP family class I SAM-dependent RNA methyltransferase [Candidatus Pacearchaeota archaeon]|nr:RsmB/NOP family class I SAM-dependent RNA methyltransferase [Candidatus Pacearchaeota archaeon]
MNFESKPLFVERMKKLLENEEDAKEYFEILSKPELKSFRVNTLKTTPEKLKEMLEKKNWKIKQPIKNHPEIMVVDSKLFPGELGRSLEHILGYYYVQEITSMLPILALNPKPEENILDLAASPGSKTTQIAALMKNAGTLIANDVKLQRIKILASNLERCGVTNEVITKSDGAALCRKLKMKNFLFDKILVDAPCSGEGTFRSMPKTFPAWNIKKIYSLSRIQKNLLENAIEVLKPNGEIVYSTCTHAPEENEEIINYVLEKFKNIRVEKITLPVKCRSGITKWNDEIFSDELKNTCRIYPQDNNTEGFFIAKLKKIK